MTRNRRLYHLAWLLPVLLALLSPPLAAEEGGTWFRGQLHMHTYWSDGRGFPEQAIDAYKRRGYAFLAISDHNRFAQDKGAWREVAAEEGPWPPKITQSIFDSYVRDFGKDGIETKTEGDKTLVRLRTYEEMKARFDEPGRFLLLPGVEITQDLRGPAVHMNYINLPLLLPSIEGRDLIHKVTDVNTTSELIAKNASEAAQAGKSLEQPYLFMVNHPFWVYYDVLAQNLLDCPEVRFFELVNGGSSFAPAAGASRYTVEQFWDVVNAFRCVQNQPLLYGIGSDDAHFYDAERIDGMSGVGDAWIMVRAAALAPEHLLAAMNRGDFYVSSGVLLDEVTFTPAEKTLRVKVRAEEGVSYRIHFVTTKRGFDRTVTEVVSPAEKDRPARKIPVYSEDIGRTVETVAGNEATYRMEPDDLYVRACVESDRPAKSTPHFHPKVHMAWTQPYAVGGGK